MCRFPKISGAQAVSGSLQPLVESAVLQSSAVFEPALFGHIRRPVGQHQAPCRNLADAQRAADAREGKVVLELALHRVSHATLLFSQFVHAALAGRTGAGIALHHVADVAGTGPINNHPQSPLSRGTIGATVKPAPSGASEHAGSKLLPAVKWMTFDSVTTHRIVAAV